MVSRLLAGLVSVGHHRGCQLTRVGRHLRDALAAELLLYKIKYEGYDGPSYIVPSYDREAAYANDAYYPAGDLGGYAEPGYVEPGYVDTGRTYAPDEYAY